ncbi:MAG: type IV secretion protein Rhs [Lysobacter sp.]|nr:type IV secretion protein Rhs [Lysobacter sp.]
MLRNSRRLLLTLALLVGAGALAAVLAPTVPPTFCTTSGCYPTLDKAEAAVRASPGYAGVGSLVEHMQTVRLSATSVRQQYWLRDRPVASVRGLAYYAAYGLQGGSTGSCTLSDDQIAKPGWCADEGELVNLGLSRMQAAWASAGCTVTETVITKDYDPPGLSASPGTRGIVGYGARNYRTRGTCTNGATKTQTWSISKQRPVYCRTNFGAIPMDTVSEATLTTANLCEADQSAIAQITMPIQQCASCPGSPNPVYPATGEKQRAEPDFTFAGQTFTRYYRSLRQFRNNPSFAVGWSHSYAERFLVSTNDHIDEAGNYEGYVSIGGNRYRAANAPDRIAEKVNAGGISWRLRMPDGEVREFDTSGYLIAIRNPNDPLNDVVIAYTADKAMSTVTDAQGRALRFEYADNLLRRIVLPDGADVAYAYDANLNLTAVTYPGGATKQYHYNEPGLAGDVDQRHHLTGITSEDGQRFASFGYDARGRVTSSRVLGTPNELTTVSYPTEDSAVIQTAEGDSRAYTIQPGTYRRILGAVDSGGSAAQTFDTQGRLATSTDKRGILTRYEYAADYRSATVVAADTPEQRREEVTRDPATRLITEARTLDHLGALVARTTWTYNARNQVSAITAFDPDGATGATRSATMTYCETADVTAGSCPRVGLVTKIDGPRAGAADGVTYTYRMADEPACAASPSTCAYRKGDLWKATNALGHVVETLRSDGADRPLSLRDANGIVTDLEYDPRGQMIASKVRGSDDGSEADDRITRIEYTPAGTVHRVILPDGVYTQFGYDAALRLTSVADPAGNTMVFTLNAAGEPLKEDTRDTSGALLRTLSRTYDTLGRLQTQSDADLQPTGFGYDPEDNLTLTTDALNHKTAHSYDALGRLKTTLQDVDGVAAQTQFQYDALDRLTQVLDPGGLPTTYTYNGFGEVLTLQSQDTGLATSTYDEAGNLKTRTDARGITETYSYDLLNRVTAVSYPDSSRNVSLVYDSAPVDCPSGERFNQGQLSVMTDSSGSTGYCYDRYGQLSRKLQLTQGRSYALRYLNTDPRGWLPDQTTAVQNPPPGNQYIGLIHPDGSSVRIVRDAQSRPSELKVTLATGQTKTLLSGATHYPFGPVSRWTYGNGRILRRSLNQNYQPGFVEDTTAGGISEGYSFDAAGNLESLRKADQLDPARRAYRYDGLNRLTQVRDGANGANGTVLQAYTYDGTGNRTSRTDSGTATTYVYGPARHRLTQIGTEGRSYDAVGNTTRIEKPGAVTREFAYDDANRMRQVKRDGVVAMSYLYNGKGEQVYKTGSGRTIATLYDEAGHWIGDYDANGQPIQQAIWLDGLPVGLLVGAGANQKLYYIEADALGTPRVVIDPDRNVAIWNWNLANEAFGDSAANEDPDADGTTFVFDMRFPGQRYDAASGLSQNHFRDYDAATGRYAQSDPIGIDGGISTYGYANGAPTMYGDPDGLIAGRIGLQLVTRFVLPRLGIQLGARAAVRVTRARVAQHMGMRTVARTASHSEVLTAESAACRAGSGAAKRAAPPNLSPAGAGRRGAFNEAKRQSGIPTSQQPSRVLTNVDKRGNLQPGRIYEFEIPAPGGGTRTMRIRNDAGGHNFGPANPQNRGPHFNDAKGNHYDY